MVERFEQGKKLSSVKVGEGSPDKTRFDLDSEGNFKIRVIDSKKVITSIGTKNGEPVQINFFEAKKKQKSTGF